jgi:hypothetical protein
MRAGFVPTQPCRRRALLFCVEKIASSDEGTRSRESNPSRLFNTHTHTIHSCCEKVFPTYVSKGNTPTSTELVPTADTVELSTQHNQKQQPGATRGPSRPKTPNKNEIPHAPRQSPINGHSLATRPTQKPDKVTMLARKHAQKDLRGPEKRANKSCTGGKGHLCATISVGARERFRLDVTERLT